MALLVADTFGTPDGPLHGRAAESGGTWSVSPVNSEYKVRGGVLVRESTTAASATVPRIGSMAAGSVVSTRARIRLVKALSDYSFNLYPVHTPTVNVGLLIFRFSSQLVIRLTSTSGAETLTWSSTEHPLLTVGAWYEIGCDYDKATGRITAWFDGQPVTGAETPHEAALNIVAPAGLACPMDTTGTTAAEIDSLYVHDTPHTDTEAPAPIAGSAGGWAVGTVGS